MPSSLPRGTPADQSVDPAAILSFLDAVDARPDVEDQFWMSRHGYRGDGAFGQFCVILPEQDTVIVTTAYTIDMQAVLDAMWAPRFSPS